MKQARLYTKYKADGIHEVWPEAASLLDGTSCCPIKKPPILRLDRNNISLITHSLNRTHLYTKYTYYYE